ncbi:ABC transporter family protein [Leucobacter komagatae]|uniref:ABC transporter family protein n=1 Tax=Leucobacter komagatae TaxID=55969 RepID=A0A542Y213_9MICO|nr:ATP-binding cassette domain-containing protein [Leucobacter komagatae]TQL42120.1 ABC transporter family protein [Leucobacter komagatae]
MSRNEALSGEAPGNGRAGFAAGMPPVARRRVRGVALGWAGAALAEAAAYLALALAIRDGLPVFRVIALAAVAMVATVVVSRAGYLSGARLAGDLYAEMGRVLARAKLSWFTAANRAVVTTAAGRSVPTFMGVPAHLLQTLVLSLLLPVALVAAVAIVGGYAMAGLVLLLLSAALVAQVIAQRFLAAADASRHAAEGQATAATLELVERLELLRTAAGPARALERAEQAWRSGEDAMSKTNRAAAPATLISQLASVLPLAGVLVALGVTGAFEAPALALALVVLVGRASAPIDDLALVGIALTEVRAHTEAYRHVVGAPVLPAYSGEPASTTPVSGGVEVRRVSQAPALTDITLSVPSGERALIAGPSGSGKSTLLGLVLRFDDAEQGEVLLDGVPVRTLSPGELAERIAYVPQEPIVFTGTLAENLRIGRPSASDEELREAAFAARLGDVLGRDPRGLGQDVGSHGQRLSGGERQRVAIARALLSEAPVLVLDEATSALDEPTEQLIADEIVRREKTLLVVTHRRPEIWQPHRVINLGVSGAKARGRE